MIVIQVHKRAKKDTELKDSIATSVANFMSKLKENKKLEADKKEEPKKDTINGKAKVDGGKMYIVLDKPLEIVVDKDGVKEKKEVKVAVPVKPAPKKEEKKPEPPKKGEPKPAPPKKEEPKPAPKPEPKIKFMPIAPAPKKVDAKKNEDARKKMMKHIMKMGAGNP